MNWQRVHRERTIERALDRPVVVDSGAIEARAKARDDRRQEIEARLRARGAGDFIARVQRIGRHA